MLNRLIIAAPYSLGIVNNSLTISILFRKSCKLHSMHILCREANFLPQLLFECKERAIHLATKEISISM